MYLNFVREFDHIQASLKSSLFEQISWEWPSKAERASIARKTTSRIEYLKLYKSEDQTQERK